MEILTTRKHGQLGRPRKLNPRLSKNTIHVTLSDLERAAIESAAHLEYKDYAVYVRDKALEAARLTQSTQST